MPACLICNARDASHIFPKSEILVKKWITSLGLHSPPSEGSRICKDHFSPSDYKPGSTRLTKIAVPTPNLAPYTNSAPSTNSTPSAYSDHTYSLTSKDPRAALLSLWITLIPVMICWVPFLLVLCYCCTECNHTSSATTSAAGKDIYF